MRLLPMAIAIILATMPALSAQSAEDMTPTAQLIDTLSKGHESNQYFVNYGRSADTTESRIQFRIWRGDTLLHEEELIVAAGDRGSTQTYNGVREAAVFTGHQFRVKKFISVYDRQNMTPKLEAFYERELRIARTLPFTHFNFADLDFYVLYPGADRVQVSVDRRTVAAFDPRPWGPGMEERFRARAGGEYTHVATFDSVLTAVAEYWQTPVDWSAEPAISSAQ